ncbi:MAG TPA: hemolysin family protein [Bryobacteraceae bacterium]|jgi:CBS domain containing-hemolysin-like protein|nr:hemolysin family protein [Bryobacteraceae bacterium]
MTLLLTILAGAAALVVTLVTCIQLLYLESLRLRARELPSLQFFRETLEPKIGLDTEKGALTFSVVKHLGLAIVGCLTLAVTWLGTPGWQALTAAILMVSAFTVIGTHIVPQIVYRKSDAQGLLPLVPVFKAVAILSRPLTWALEAVLNLFDLHGKHKPDDAPRPDEHIEALITAGREEGIIEEADRELIQSVVAFGDKTVRELMTPRPRIVAIHTDATLEELRELVLNEQFSRIPAYEKTIDEIEGFVHVRDMFELDEKQRARRRVRDIMRPIRAVPETKRVTDLLREMQDDGAHMVVVVDEYGSTAGIVTMEDMVEEIVGEIHDEHEPDRDFREEPDGSFIVSGSFDLGRLSDLVDFHPSQDTQSTTVGGLVTEWLGHVPTVGEEVEREGLFVKVLASNNLRVDQVRVSKAAIK